MTYFDKLSRPRVQDRALSSSAWRERKQYGRGRQNSRAIEFGGEDRRIRLP
jgi:hypothetical protein